MFFIKSFTAALLLAAIDIIFLAWCFVHCYSPAASLGAALILDILGAVLLSHFFIAD